MTYYDPLAHGLDIDQCTDGSRNWSERPKFPGISGFSEFPGVRKPTRDGHYSTGTKLPHQAL